MNYNDLVVCGVRNVHFKRANEIASGGDEKLASNEVRARVYPSRSEPQTISNWGLAGNKPSRWAASIPPSGQGPPEYVGVPVRPSGLSGCSVPRYGGSRRTSQQAVSVLAQRR